MLLLSLLLLSLLVLYVSSYRSSIVVKVSTRVRLQSSNGDDFLTSFVKRFLPTPEDVGLTRSGNRIENYPAVLDKYAEVLKEDGSDDRALIRQTLAQTNLEFRPLKLLYDADKDGWSAKKFHNKVDKMGPAVVIATTKSGGVIGGYNPTGWVNLGEYRYQHHHHHHYIIITIIIINIYIIITTITIIITIIIINIADQ